jgi:hypothetical protein
MRPKFKNCSDWAVVAAAGMHDPGPPPPGGPALKLDQLPAAEPQHLLGGFSLYAPTPPDRSVRVDAILHAAGVRPRRHTAPTAPEPHPKPKPNPARTFTVGRHAAGVLRVY